MRKGILKSFVLIALALVLVFSTTVAYAAPAKNKVDVQIERFGTNKIQVVEDGKVSIIEVAQVSDTVAEVRLYEPGEDTWILTVDQENQTITSSETGKTVRVSDLVEVEESSSRYTHKTKTLKYSYYKIYNQIEKAITIARIATVILALIIAYFNPGAALEFFNKASEIIDFIENIKNLVKLVTGHSKKAGLKINLKSYQKTVHHGGKTYTLEYWRVTKISKYNDA